MAEGEERAQEEQEDIRVEEASQEPQMLEEEEQTQGDAAESEEIETGKEEEVMAEEREEKVVAGEELKFLTYAAVGLAIVALFFSFWGFSTQLKEKKLEAKEAALEKKVEKMGRNQVVSDFTLKAAQVYMLTMVDRNYAAAQKVVAEMKAESAAFGGSGAKLNALLNALDAEVKKGPSPIPGLVNALSAEVKAAAGIAPSVVAVPAKAVVKPASELKIEAVPEKPKAGEAKEVKKKESVEKDKEITGEAKKEPAPEKKKALSKRPHPAKDAGGLTGSMFHMWQKLSPYSDSK